MAVLANRALEGDCEPNTMEEQDTTARPIEGRARRSLLGPTSPVLVYIGVGVIVAGFVLIAIAWGEVAGLTSVGLQMPYLVSAGLTGLGLVVVGLIAIAFGITRQDDAKLAEQIQMLGRAVAELHKALSSEGDAK